MTILATNPMKKVAATEAKIRAIRKLRERKPGCGLGDWFMV
jgi:hypothetical protein